MRAFLLKTILISILNDTIIDIMNFSDQSHSEKAKYNICWISIAVIFLGTIAYPIMFEHATRTREIMAERYVKDNPIFVIPTTEVTQVNTMPEDLTEGLPADNMPNKEAFELFNRNLKTGDKGEDVKRLQEYLNARGFIVAETGPGSPGAESILFGAGTREALKNFQEAYSDILLKPYGLSEGTGFFGEATRNFINS